MKQLESDPWEGASAKYPVGGTFSGRVTNITEYGAFVELEPGIEGLVHVSEMSWTKKNVHPGKIVSTSQEVDVKVLEVDEEKRRISLGLKQAQSNPWEAFAETHPVGAWSRAKSRTRPSSACSSASRATSTAWSTCRTSPGACRARKRLQLHRKGETVKAQVLDVDVEKERISLGMKQLEGGGAGAGASAAARRGRRRRQEGRGRHVIVRAVQDAGLDVQVGDDGATGFVKRDRSWPRSRRAASGAFPGRAEVRRDGVGFDRSKKPNFSIKAMQIAEEKQAVAQYGSSDSGASLGDILGAALKEAQAGKADKATKKKKQVTEIRGVLEGRRVNPACVGQTFLTASARKRPPVLGGNEGRSILMRGLQ